MDKLQTLKVLSHKGVEKSTRFVFPLQLQYLTLIHCLYSFEQISMITRMNNLISFTLIDNEIPCMSLPTKIKYLIVQNNKHKILVSNKSCLLHLK